MLTNQNIVVRGDDWTPLGGATFEKQPDLAGFFARTLALGPAHRGLKSVCKAACSRGEFQGTVIVATSRTSCEPILGDEDLDAASLKGCERWARLRTGGDAPVLIGPFPAFEEPCDWFRQMGPKGAIIAAPICLDGLPFHVALLAATTRSWMCSVDFRAACMTLRGLAKIAALHMRPAAKFVNSAILDRRYADVRSISRVIPAYSRPIALIDGNLMVIAANEAFAKIHKRDLAVIVGAKLQEFQETAAGAVRDFIARAGPDPKVKQQVRGALAANSELLVDIFSYPASTPEDPTFLMRFEPVSLGEAD